MVLPAFTVALLGLIAAPAAHAQAPGPMETYMGFEGRAFMDGATRLPYRLFKPIGYDPATKYPLILFLHGGGEGGTDNFLPIAKNIGQSTPGSIFTTPENQARWPVFFVAPQSANKFWNNNFGNAAQALVMALQQEFPNIDPQRLYLTGLSLGGQGAWYLADRSPMMWAAVIPMAGVGSTGTAPRIFRLPIWNFHSAMDENTNVSTSRAMINALKAAGGTPCYTEYPTGEHRLTWIRSYTNPDLLPWMYSQRAGMPDQYGCPMSAGGMRPNLSPDAGVPDASSGSDAVAEVATDTGNPGGSGGSGGNPGTGGNSGSGGSGGADAGATTGSGGAGGSPPSTGSGGVSGGGGKAGSGAGSSGGGGCRIAAGATSAPSRGGWSWLILATMVAALRRRR